MYLNPKSKVTPMLTALALASTLADAQILNETQYYEVPVPSHFFGNSIGVSDDLLAAGFRDLSGSGDSGIHLFDLNTGLLLRTFIPTSATQILNAGRDVAIDGLTVACTERGSGGLSYANPSVFVFDAIAGQRFEVVPDLDDNSGGVFGLSIDVKEGVVAIGSALATVDAGTGFQIGKVYLIDENTGARLGTIHPSEASENFGCFGSSIDIHNGIIAVGANQFNAGIPIGGNTERVELFDLATQQHIRTIYSPADPIDPAGFGFDIAMNDQYLVVAAPWQDHTGVNSGAVHVYNISTGDLVSTLEIGEAINPGAGTSTLKIQVDINNDGLVLVSQSGGSTQKSAIYQASSGVELAVLEPSSGSIILPSDTNGVALSGGSAFVGIPRFNINEPGAINQSVVMKYESNVSIAVQPQSLVVENEGVDFFMQVVTTGATSYQWYLDGVAVSDLDENYTGSTESLLVITSGPEVEGVYTVEVSDGPFSITSDPAYYIYRGQSVPACQPDLNDDGQLNFLDVSLFLQQYGAGCP
jgi:WD40 repeat protein